MWKIREQIDKVTNVVMMFTDAEIKVREATNDEQWGPHGTLMGEIAKLTYRQQCYQEVRITQNNFLRILRLKL